jgi:hypothetical protein
MSSLTQQPEIQTEALMRVQNKWADSMPDYEDVVEARSAALQDGKSVQEIRIQSLSSFAEDSSIQTADSDTDFNEEQIGTVGAMPVYEGDRNVLITQDGTEYPL